MHRSQVTFEATHTIRTTVSIEKWAPLHMAPPKFQALEPNVGDHLESSLEKSTYVCLFLTIRNTAIDQGVAICKEIMAPGQCIHAGQRP